MKAFWSDTRPNGQPVEAGTVCFITDLEDGTHPIATYGKDRDEVLEKLAQQNANAQLAIARRTPPSAPAAPPPPAKPRMTADEVMQATVDLTNPAKAPGAVAALFEHQTGLSPEQIILKNFGDLAQAWQDAHPEFFAHKGNVRMMTVEAAKLAGGLGKVTDVHLDRAFVNLHNRGELFEAAFEPPPQPSPTFPDETQVQRTERPRPRFATGARSTGFRSQAPARTLKYTEEQIRSMPLSKSRELINSGDKDYAEACEHYFGSSAQASA